MKRRSFLLASGTALASPFLVGSASAHANPTEPAVRSMAASASATSDPDEHFDVERDGDVLHVEGVTRGSSGCSAVALDEVVGGHGGALIELTPVRDAVVCTDVVTAVEYEFDLAFDHEAPSVVDVRVTDRSLEGPLVRSLSFEPGEGAESHEVTREPALDSAVVSGTLVAADACTGYEYVGTEREGDAATVRFASHRPEDLLCAQVQTPIDYELVLAFPDGLPDRIEVDAA